MTVRPAQEDLSAYFAQAAAWDEDRLKEAERSRRLAWTVAATACCVATLATLAVCLLAPLKSVEPFIVRVDRSTGAVDVVSALSSARDQTPDEAVSKFFLARYVRVREGWLAASEREDFRQAALMSSASEQLRLAELHRPSNSQNPRALYGPDVVIDVQIRAISFINEKVAQIRFRRTLLRAAEAESQDWIATVGFDYVRTPMREADRLINPLGFQITSYRADPEVVP